MLKQILWIIDPNKLADTETVHSLADRLIGEYQFGTKDHRPSRIIVNGNGVGIALFRLLLDAGLPAEEVCESSVRPVSIPLSFRSTP